MKHEKKGRRIDNNKCTQMRLKEWLSVKLKVHYRINHALKKGILTFHTISHL